MRIVSAALLAFAMLVVTPMAHARFEACPELAQTHSAEAPASHHQSDTTPKACCSAMCVACVGVAAISATTVETEFSGASFTIQSPSLSGRTPRPGFEPPRLIA